MKVNQRTQAERSATTRAALVAAARPLFGAHGFAGVGTETIVRAAGVSRGALYHQFADKTELFAAVLEAVEAELMERIGERLATLDDPERLLEAGGDAWLDACAEPDVERIVLIDGPAVLGWARWREICLRSAGGLVETALRGEIDAGRLAPQPVRPLAHLLMGAFDEAALYVARAEEPERARAEMGAALRRLLGGLAR